MRFTKKLLATVLCVAILSSLFIGLDMMQASALGTMNDVRYVAAHNLSNSLYSGFERKSYLFAASDGGSGDENTYVTETTGLRPTRQYEKLNAKRLEVTIPDTGNNTLAVGDDVSSKYFLTLSNKRNTAKTSTTPANLTSNTNRFPSEDVIPPVGISI